MEFPKKVLIYESGLRDGLQNEKVLLSVDQKLQLVDKIIDSGIRVIELGSFVRPNLLPSMANTPELFERVNATPEKYEGIDFRALVPNMKGLERAIECGCKSVKIGVSASKTHAMRNYNRLPEETIAAFEDIFLKAYDNGLSVMGTVQMGFGSPWEGPTPIETVIAIVKHYERFNIKLVGIADTGSMSNPRMVYETICTLRDEFPDISFKVHFHNARGLALPNILAALQAGVTEFDGCFAGLGGCPFVPDAAGNIATEDVVNMLESMGIDTGVDIEKTMQISRDVEELVGHRGNTYLLRADTCENLIRKMNS